MRRGGLRLSRRAPQIVILLDILMLWVFALLSLPTSESGIRYRLVRIEDGIMDNTLIVKGNDPSNPEAGWIIKGGIPEPVPWARWQVPVGLPGLQCSDGTGQCLGNIFDGSRSQEAFIFYPPPVVTNGLEKLYYRACTSGRCSNVIYLHLSDGAAEICGFNAHWWSIKMDEEPVDTKQKCSS